MNDSSAFLATMHGAVAADRMNRLLNEACNERLARLARGAAPSRQAVRRAHLVDGLRHARHASVEWLRKGQLAGYPTTCKTC